MKNIFTIKLMLWVIPLLVIMSASETLAHHDQQILDREVTLDLKDVPLAVALTEIEIAAGIKFVYSPNQLDLAQVISLQVNRKRLGLVLNDLLGPLAIIYTVDKRNEYVLLKPVRAEMEPPSFKKELPIVPTFAEVRGTVTDAVTQLPIAGVNIVVKGTTSGTTTDSEGKYVINAEKSDVLVFSFIGYEKFETQVDEKTIIDVILQEGVASLQEVVVNAGYYSTTDKTKTGNITRIEAKEIENQPVTSPLMTLQGRVAGLDVVPNNGAPGSATKIQIRGQNSIRTNGSYPLYVIDGVPIDSRPLEGASDFFDTGIDPFISIDPANIASIEILKDADATAIYGSRGANGVILISTKKGTGVKSSNFNAGIYKGVGKITNKLNLLNTSQYIAMREEALRETDISPRPIDYDLNGTWDKNRDTDWQETLLGGTAHITNLQINLSGGSDNTTFNLGGGYHNETLIYPGDFGYKRFTGRFALNHSSSNQKFESSISINYGGNNTKLFNDYNLMAIILELPPNAPALYDENGELNWAPTSGNTSSWVNPLSLSRKSDEVTNSSLLVNANVSYKFHPNFKLRANLGYNDTNGDQTLKIPISSKDPNNQFASKTAESTFAINKRGSWIVEPQLIYQKKSGNHNVNIILGTSFQESTSEYLNTLATGYSSDVLLGTLSGAADIQIINDVHEEYHYAAIFSRIGYDFANKYFLNLTARRDGSSRFGPGKQFGNFGAIGLAWIFSNESFIQTNLPFLSFGKLRSSYGVTGNDQIGDYKYFDTYSPTFYSYQGAVSLHPTRLYNPDLRWELTKKLEITMQSDFFDEKISFDASWYRNTSSNQLVDLKVPATTGFPTVLSNFAALVENSGWEFNLHSINLKKANFLWTTSANYTIPKNELVEFKDIQNSAYASLYKVGEPLNIKQYYTYIGVDPTTGLHVVEDIDKNGIINNGDKTFKQPITRRFGGLNNSIRYKGLELSVLFQFVIQNRERADIFDTSPGQTRSNQPASVLDRWQKEGDASDVQKFGTSNNVRNEYNRFRTSDVAVQNASFIRLKTLSLSYVVPNSIINAVYLKQARIYAQGQNIITITDFEGLDPETGNTLPPLKMITAGLQLHF